MELSELMTFYDEVYHGEPVPAADFPRLFVRAEETLQILTLGRLYTAPEPLLHTVKRALCAQIEYYVLGGIETASLGVSAGSFTTGHVSVSGAAEASAGAGIGVCERAMTLLAMAGLLYRGCAVC